MQEFFLALVLSFFYFIFEQSLKVIDGKIGDTKYSLPFRLMK
jgi:hypothetical protein